MDRETEEYAAVYQGFLRATPHFFTHKDVRMNPKSSSGWWRPHAFFKGKGAVLDANEFKNVRDYNQLLRYAKKLQYKSWSSFPCWNSAFAFWASSSSKQTRNSSAVWNLSLKSFLFARKNEFDTYVLTGVYLVSRSIYAILGRHMPKHTFDDQEIVKKAMKNEWRNPKKILRTLPTLSIQRGVSIIFRLRDSNIYDRGHWILSGTVFKKDFLRCAPFLLIASFQG